MDFTVGLMVVAIAVLLVGPTDTWPGPVAGRYLSTVGALLAATMVAQGLGVIIDDNSGTRALILIARLLLAGAIVVFVNGALEAKRGGGAPTPPSPQGF